MDSKQELALDFIYSHPESAAKQIETLAPDQTVELIDQIGFKAGAFLLPNLLPQYVAQIVSQQVAANAAELLNATDVSFIAAVLRCLKSSKRNSILGHLASTKRASVMLLLNFAEDAVGSWMNPAVATLAGDTSVDAARKYLKTSDTLVYSDRVFVVDRNRSLVGHVSQIELTRANKKAPLTDVLVPARDALLARMTVQTAAGHPAWSQTDVMPVNNRSGNFVGAVRHVELRKAMDKLSSTQSMPSRENPLEGLAAAYGNTVLTLFNTLEDIVRDTRPDERDK